MAKILFYGDNPLSNTANAYMNTTIIRSLEKAGHEILVLGFSPIDLRNVFSESGLKSKIIPITSDYSDPFGERELLHYINDLDFDFLVTNNDLWRLNNLARKFSLIKEQKSIKWIGVFPCDCDTVKPDWVFIMNQMDLPIVYSKHGFDLYCQKVPNLRYWKPIVDASKFKPLENKFELKTKIFNIPSDSFLIGVVAKNQFRKDLVRSLEVFKAFQIVHPNSYIYFHTNVKSDLCGDISAVVKQMDIPNVILRNQNIAYLTQERLCSMYNSFDCLLVTSLGEGLCYPIIEAQLCNVPVIGAANTAITELIDEGKGFVCSLSLDTAPLPITVDGIQVTEQRKRVDVQDCLGQLEIVYKGSFFSESNESHYCCEMLRGIKGSARENALTYTKNSDSISRLMSRIFDKVQSKRSGKPKERLLFCQYASAGDVLITTGILKGMKEKYGLDIDYMTQPMYFDILQGNSDIGKIIEWDMKVSKLYKAYAYPHKVIRTGNWGTNDISLYDVYAQLCEVEYGQMFIDTVEPIGKNGEYFDWGDYITVHNKGGHHYRYYPYMNGVIDILSVKYPNLKFMQVGASDDPRLEKAIDVRGVSFRESAYIIKNAKVHIGIDSFPAHCAAAVGQKQVCLYGCGAKRVIQPRGRVINIEPDYVKVCPILGPCWGNYQACGGNCIRSIHPERVAKAAIDLIESN